MIITNIDGEDKTLYANEPCNEIEVGNKITFTYKKKDQRSAKGNVFSSVRFVKKVSEQEQTDELDHITF